MRSSKWGQTVAIIETEGGGIDTSVSEVEDVPAETLAAVEETVTIAKEHVAAPVQDFGSTQRFYSPLVRNIAKQEGIPVTTLDTIQGSGKEGRVTKSDILAFISNGKETVTVPTAKIAPSPIEPIVRPETIKVVEEDAKPATTSHQVTRVQATGGDEVIEMTRMGKLIAKHMVDSVSTSAHVQSFIEVDVTNVVNWRNKMKDAFEKSEGEKLTFTPIFMEAVAKALKKYPMINISVDGDTVIKKKNINIGMAAALPDGNLIVPVIKNADQLNLVGMAKVVNDLAGRSRANQLKPDEVQDGTYTVTNVGTFGSVFGTPIINQPQVGILALGAIRKIPSVIETSEGDFIGIRSKMYISHSYDHRVVNGALGSMFAKAVADYLEAWDVNREV